jgi:hypothetical protein
LISAYEKTTTDYRNELDSAGIKIAERVGAAIIGNGALHTAGAGGIAVLIGIALTGLVALSEANDVLTLLRKGRRIDKMPGHALLQPYKPFLRKSDGL